jgi:hypothetical protein
MKRIILSILTYLFPASCQKLEVSQADKDEVYHDWSQDGNWAGF